tara:strand:+ start:750 stop:2483 length:1734 start_codon:yes stop_codon:yes gene_type:complete
MEWQDWLEKTEPTGLTPKQRKLAKEIADGDKDDHTQYYTKASWETWLEKEEKPKERDYLAEMQTLGNQNMYQNSSKKKKFLKEAKGAGKKIEQQMGENKLPLSYSNRLRTNIKRPAERVTDNDLSDLDGWVEETKSWESWLEKNDPCWEGYEQYGMKDKDGKKVPNCIKKNNAIETSHKEDEKKHEWDGKFSSSTIRDDVKDDDDKAVSEEESLEELTDGKLEEVEKLKSWELWLEKDALDGKGGNEAKDDLMMPSLMGMYKKPTKQTKEGQARDYIRDDHNVDSYHMRRLGHGKKYESGRRPLEKKPQSGGFVNGSRKEEWDITADQDASKRGSGTNTFDDKDDVEPSGGFIQGQGRTVPKTGIAPNIKPQGKGVKHKGRPRGSKNKAWEDWLEKDALNPDSKDKPSLMNTQRFARISTEVRGGNAQGGKLGDASLRGMRAEEKKRGKKYKWKNPDRKGRGGEKKELYHGTERQAGNYPALGTDSGKESGEKFAKLFQEEKKSWESWLEKMQGAGDARFGNQHLTGLDQKPVDNEEDEANILPEKEQKTDNKEEKQEKTEDKEDKDNKPYKALSQE